MGNRLSKNTFARLFPAMRDPDIATAFLRSQQEDENPGLSSFVDENLQGHARTPNMNANGPSPMNTPGYENYSDPDRPAPATPTTRSPFQMPQGAYTPPDAAPAPVNDPPEGADPLAIETLSRIGQASKVGRNFASDEAMMEKYSAAANQQTPGPAPAGRFGVPADRSNGTDSLGRAYVDPADQPPPELPESMRPKRQKSALEDARDKYEAVRTRKIVDKDKGIKGRAYEAIANVLEGMAMTYKANPNGHWAGILAGGAAGGVIGGTMNRTWNEQREHQKELGMAERNYEAAKTVAEDDEKLAQSQSKREVDAFEAMTKREKLIYDQLDERKKNVLSQLRDIDEIDPDSKDPRVQEFIKQAAAAGVQVLKKSKNSKFSFDITPDGQLIIGDTTTGAYKKGQGNYSKPPAFSPNELPDEMFGIKDDKAIDDEALAAIGKDFPNRRLRPERANQLKEMKDEAGNPLYLNPDGSVNDAKALTDGVLDDGAYEAGPDNYQQKLAAKRGQARASQAALKAEVANFRTAISNQRPRPDAQDTSVTKVKDLFLRIMQLPPKDRKAKLKAFYENLPNIRITG